VDTFNFPALSRSSA